MSTIQHMNRARRLGGIDSINYDNPTALVDLNIGYHDIEDTIKKLQEDFFWQNFFLEETVINQSEYTIPTNCEKIIEVSIKYDAEDDYKKARLVDITNLPFEIDWYKINQSSSDPIYHISDNSYFIYPSPSQVVAEGVKIAGIEKLADLTEASTESEIFAGKIPAKYHYLLEMSMLEPIYLQRQMINEAVNARQRYELEKQSVVRRLTRRYIGPVQVENPNLKHFS